MAEYFNKITGEWEDEKTSPYCRGEKLWKKYLDKIGENTQYNTDNIRVTCLKSRNLSNEGLQCDLRDKKPKDD